jgi:hypothetical protein
LGVEIEEEINEILSFYSYVWGGENDGNCWGEIVGKLSHLNSFSRIEIGRKIKSFIVSFHNFGGPNLGIYLWNT